MNHGAYFCRTLKAHSPADGLLACWKVSVEGLVSRYRYSSDKLSAYRVIRFVDKLTTRILAAYLRCLIDLRQLCFEPQQTHSMAGVAHMFNTLARGQYEQAANLEQEIQERTLGGLTNRP